MTDTVNAPERDDELLPCPFCGGEAWYNIDHTTELCNSVWCRACDFGVFDPNGTGSSVAAWNRRTHCDELVAAAYLDARERCGPQKCKGCVHFQRTRDRWPSGDGETYDYGTENKCLAADRLIEETVYGSMNPSSPDWCPHPITPDNARAALTARDERMKAEGALGAQAELIEEPTEPGSFVGDIWFGRQDNRTYGTHRWDGAAWQALPTETEALIGLLAKERAKIARLTEALKEIAHQKKTSELDTEYDVECADFEAGYDACIDRARAALQENKNV